MKDSRYEEALERARKGMSIDEIFPEFKECEDEKIMKLIAETVFRYYGDSQEYLDVLAYLEKQKEQKPESCDCSRDEESYTNGIHHVLMNPEVYGLIKQKPAEQLDGTFTSYDMAKTFTEGQNYVIAHPEKFGLCKPAEWSEEDNINLNACIQIINDAWEKAQIKELGTTKFAPHYYGDLIDWLKSLQPNWKPSGEQMEAVEEALEFYSGTTDTAKGLRSLYNDLKKLQL